MQLQDRIKALTALGKLFREMKDEEIEVLARKAAYYNPWFTIPSIKFAFQGIIKFLDADTLSGFVSKYTMPSTERTIGLVMAGNIPWVGFHDLLCVLLAGHKVKVKLSTKDEVLPNFIINEINEIAPDLGKKVAIVEKLQDFDAIIATGSDNTSRYFEYYFGKYPNVIRKNRTSIALLDGNETPTELEKIADDIFLYFGLGCRNVSKVLLPENYDFTPLFQALEKYEEVINHNKYRNNYDYYKSIYLVNGDNFLDTGFILFKNDGQLVSPVSVVYFEYYDGMETAKNYLKDNEDKLQVVVASERFGLPDTTPPGKAQLPEINNFADRMDTMKFLTSL